jgi:UDP-N-acetylglucosamine acyltransferase
MVSPCAKIADNVSIGPFSIVEDDVEIGAGCVIDSHVVVKRYTTLGENNRLNPGVQLGTDPEDKKFSSAVRSYLRIGNGNVFREYSTASRGTPADSATVIGDNNYIMVGVHVAHNCRLGSEIIICNNCSLGGFVEIEDGAFLSAGVLVHQFGKIGRLAMISGNTGANLDVPPYVVAAEFRAVARGLNLVGLKRAGLGAEAIAQLKQAYRILYRSRLPLEEALKRIESELTSAEARHFAAFIRRSERGICRETSEKNSQASRDHKPAQE